MTIRDRVKELCDQRGFSLNQTEVACKFGKGYLSKLDSSTPSTAKMKTLADYLGVSLDYLMTGEEPEENRYYINDETAKIAQKIFEDKKLRLLFDSASDAEPEDLDAVHAMLLALKRKERGNDD